MVVLADTLPPPSSSGRSQEPQNAKKEAGVALIHARLCTDPPSPPKGPSQSVCLVRGEWSLDANGNGIWDGPAGDLEVLFGEAGDTPVVGDWNGDGTDDIGVYRDGRWFLDVNGNHQWDPGIAGGAVLSTDREVALLLAASMNDIHEIKGLDVAPFVGVLLNGPFKKAADMNQDGIVNGLDAKPFVAAVVGWSEQPGVPLDAASISATTEHLGTSASEFHRHVRDYHEGEDHQRLIHHGAVERVFSRRSRLKDRPRVPTDEVIQRMHRQHALVGDWQATVERAFEGEADWIG